MDDRMKKQLEFIIEADKLKGVLRQTLIIDKSRRENDAEHSWHVALAAMLLHEHSENPDSTDLFRVLKMALVHDLVEIYAGDTFAYDDAGNESKEQREREAADKLFSALPAGQGDELRALWQEFDAMESPDACYASAIDRLLPFVHNTLTDGRTWRDGHVTKSQVLARMLPVRSAIPGLWDYITENIDDAINKGYIRNDLQ